MSDPVCRVCRSPADPSAKSCANCGTAYEVRRAGGTQGGGAAAGRSAIVGLGAVVSVGVAGAVAYMALGNAGTQEAAISQERAQLQEVAESPAVDMPAPAEPPRAEVPSPEEPRPPSADDATEALRRSMEGDQGTSTGEPTTLLLRARVVSATGKKLPRGRPCQVNVHVAGERIQDLDVACGDVILYDTRTPLNGMSSRGSALYERARGKGWVYRVAYTDVGPRSSRSQLRLNVSERKATVFSESGDAFSVELGLDEFTEVRLGPSWFDTPSAPATLASVLQLKSESGTAPTIPSTGCKLDVVFVEASSEGPRCKAEVRCGAALLYGKGTTGFGPCEIREGAITSFEDDQETHDDGDPSFLLDMDEGTASLGDSPGQKDYALEFGIAK